MSRRLAIGMAIVAVAALAAGCGSSSTTSTATLHPRLLTSVPGLQYERGFDWSDPVNLIGQGISIPEAVYPSQVVKQLKGAGYAGGAGVAFIPPGQPGPETVEGVMKLGSPSDATKVLAYLHSLDREPPCFSQCTIGRRALALPGIPGALGVIQTEQQQQPPPGAPAPPKGAVIGPPPSTYLAEFAIGQYLYFGRTQAEQFMTKRVVAAFQAAYRRAKSAQ